MNLYTLSQIELTQRLLPNAIIKQVFGCHSVTDTEGELIGFVDGYFFLNEKYKHARIIYERFLGMGVECKVYKNK